MLTRKVVTLLDAKASGSTLLVFLCNRFTYRDAAGWREELAAGRLWLNNLVAHEDDVLTQGDTLEYRFEAKPEPAVDETVTVLQKAGDYVFLDKSGNLPCHPAGRFFNHTLWAMLKEGRIDGLAATDDIRFVNRLDRETSGVILVALRQGSARERICHKEYRVMVEGEFPEELIARGWLWTDPQGVVSKRRRYSEQLPQDGLRPESCGTVFHRIGIRHGISMVSAVLETGRTHQIRATLCSLGYPVVGDKLYGVDETMFLRFIDNSLTADDHHRLRMNRQALHACSMTVINVRGREPLTVNAPLPKDMNDLWNTLS